MKSAGARPIGRALLDPDRLLDRAALLDSLARALRGDRFALTGAVSVYVRAKRGTSAMLGLRLDWRSADGECTTLGSLYLASAEAVRDAADKAATLRIIAASAGPSLTVLDDPPALFLSFPNDRALRGLSAAADPRRLKNRLHRLGDPYSPEGLRIRHRGSSVEPLRWKPGRRAVLLARLLLRHEPSHRDAEEAIYPRVYPPRELRLQLARWRAAGRALGPRAPRVIAVDEERGFFAVAECRGAAGAFLGPPRPGSWSLLAGALRELYQAGPSAYDGLPHRGDRDDLEPARRALRDLAAWDPALRTQCREAEVRLVEAGKGLRPARGSLIHGDLAAGQVLWDGDRVSLMDWDEAAVGDPHADLASLSVDAQMRQAGGPPSESVEALAAEALGSLRDEDRWRWQVALAHARRCLAGFQSGDPNWRAPARRAVEEALRWSPPAPGRRRPTGLAPGHARLTAKSLEALLRELLDRERRTKISGVPRGAVLAAVWPDGEGALARLEDEAWPGQPAVWLRLGPHVEVWEFPRDPEIPALAPLCRSGRYRVAGHRLARRAVLRERGDRPRYLYLRPAATASETFERLHVVHGALAGAGVRTPHLLGKAPELHGWQAEPLAGAALDPGSADPAIWVRLGRLLAAAHAAAAPDALPAGGLDAALRDAERQVRLVARAGAPSSSWLERTLDSWRPRPCAGDVMPRRRSLLHGDLHPRQVLVGQALAVLDWERARMGDPEEDLGNLAAHVYWELGADGRGAWRALARAYAEGGGGSDPDRFSQYARLALLRVLAIHSWRDRDRARCLDLPCWERWEEECLRW